MISLTEPAAERLVADHAFAPGLPGFVGLAVDLLLDQPGLPPPVAGSLRHRPRLRHGFLTSRSERVLVVSGPPSPGLESSAARMTEDLPLALRVISGHQLAVLQEATDVVDPSAAGTATFATASAGLRVGLEAGLDAAGPYGLARRWHLANAVAPVLAAAFANSPLRLGRPTGWRSVRQALRRDLTPAPADADPRATWTALVMDSPVLGGPARTFREWAQSGPGDRPTITDLTRHLATVRPPVAARRYLEIDVADRQPGAGWRVPLAVTAALLDDPYAAAEAECATRALTGTPRLWERAARDGLTDPALGAAARECFVAAYGALARQGVSRDLRDAVADFLERYVLRGRCPADDVLDRATARP
ncbi:glutamate-cysteine ligase family protein [Actinoplanes friuliensis]|uniref:glutamate--cysteine ligase n=1 Tax=Actinoplanes friuliensis DSM 7358 TaxID=1246995 RepID=U5W1N4_9ACTN|nr:glutamate-cysteine ligase family protein [Actinoplanes friuliensis]AGZ43118.1 glutamate/cysteine ligase [Actinoplanes friuliensis DSM 7358]